jgi:hypothetical protein
MMVLALRASSFRPPRTRAKTTRVSGTRRLG